MSSDEARYFTTPALLRAWFKAHHAKAPELLLGYWKVGSGQPSVSWPESVDEALCVGWIDGVRRRIDDERYSIRFTPRRPGSVWSQVNVNRMAVLQAEGRMKPEGLAVFEARKAEHLTGYTFASRPDELPPAMAAQLQALPDAQAFFLAQPPGYRRQAVHWVTSPKLATTQTRRLGELLACCARGERLPHTQKYR